MFRWTVLFGLLLSSAGTLVQGQATARQADPVFVRAQTLVSDGNGAAGRALIDSLIAVTPSIAPLYPQALFWRATLAASAADAESDYKHIVVDYPLAPQAADALLRLAQLELARGDRDGALAHLQRIPRDYPRSKLLARSSYWTARVLFEKNDVSNACVANASALAQADTTEIELRNQIQYQGQRCPSSPVATASSPTAVASASSPGTVPNGNTVTAPPVGGANMPPSTPQAGASGTADVPKTAPTVEKRKAAPTPGAAVETTSTKATHAAPVERPKPPAPVERPKPPTEANDSKPSIVGPEKAPKVVSERTATKPEASVSSRSVYSVQVAAYNHRADAEKLASTLKKRGYEARVDGSLVPFRVRVGRYATEKAAEDALRKMKAKQMDGFVVRAPDR